LCYLLYVVCRRLEYNPPKSSRYPVFPHECIPEKDKTNLRNQLNDATSTGDLLLSQLADPSCANNQGDFGETALAKDLRVAEREEVDDGDGVLLGARQVGLTGLGGDEGPEL
jgi:hypothetical protein